MVQQVSAGCRGGGPHLPWGETGKSAGGGGDLYAGKGRLPAALGANQLPETAVTEPADIQVRDRAGPGGSPGSEPEESSDRFLCSCGQLRTAQPEGSVLSAGERLYDPRQCSETVRPRTPTTTTPQAQIHGLTDA